VQFPIYPRERDFRDGLATRLPGVSRATGGPCDFIHLAHGYRGGKAQNELLLLLARLSNDDKHRALHTTVAALQAAKHELKLTNCQLLGELRSPAVPPPIKVGAVVAELSVKVIGLNPIVDVKPEVAAAIFLEESINAITLLWQLRVLVGAILDAPEILTAL
jgi:hypothetical protein